MLRLERSWRAATSCSHNGQCVANVAGVETHKGAQVDKSHLCQCRGRPTMRAIAIVEDAMRRIAVVNIVASRGCRSQGSRL